MGYLILDYPVYYILKERISAAGAEPNETSFPLISYLRRFECGKTLYFVKPFHSVPHMPRVFLISDRLELFANIRYVTKRLLVRLFS